MKLNLTTEKRRVRPTREAKVACDLYEPKLLKATEVGGLHSLRRVRGIEIDSELKKTMSEK